MFERPQHVFVGHFIGSPGMNFLPAELAEGQLKVADQTLAVPAGQDLPAGSLQIGIRPEYLERTEPGAAGALPCQVMRVQDLGTSLMLTAQVAGQVWRGRLYPSSVLPAAGETVWLRVVS